MTQKVALVTGAGSGLGQGIARALADGGYDVGIHTGSNEERARSFAEALARQSGRRIEVLVSDFAKGDGAVKLFEQFNKTFDRLDLFVNNAGVTMGSRIMTMTEALFDTVSTINWKNAYFCVQQAARVMAKKEIAGNMVLISSNHHAIIGMGNSIYSLVKEDLIKLTKHAAMEFAPFGIRVNCIAPGWVNTGEKRMEGYHDDSIKSIPLKRWVEPEEIGEIILFLASPAMASLTGDILELDGGVRLMHGDPKHYMEKYPIGD